MTNDEARSSVLLQLDRVCQVGARAETIACVRCHRHQGNGGGGNRGANRGSANLLPPRMNGDCDCPRYRPAGVLPNTVTGVPALTELKKAIASCSGMRTQPCDAG